MPFGFHGKILTVDLTNEKFGEMSINEEDVRKFTLGSGLAAKILLDEFPFTEPLAPESPLLFLSGLLTGTNAPTACKLSVCARSPLTGIWNEATVGGHWPAELRFTGYDGILFTGKAKKPVYLYIGEDKIELRPAEKLWGKDTYETAALIQSECPPRTLVAAIGPAGENLVSIAAICFDPPNARHAARAGIGANMGSKNLKAIAVKGSGKKIAVADPEKLKEHLKEDTLKIKNNAKGLSEFGTAGGAPAVESFGDLSIKNWYLGSFPQVTEISGQKVRETIFVKHYACWACPIGCGKIVQGELPGFGKFYGHYAEYETVGMLGSQVLNADLNLLSYANELANRLGIDTISGGAAVAFAIECFEKKKISKKDTGGMEYRWGDATTIVSLLKDIAYRRNLGAVLAYGTKRAAEIIGKNTIEFTSTNKGLEYPAHDPRGHVGMALNYATAVRGACHLEGLTYFLDRGVPAVDFGITTPPNQFEESDKPQIVFTMQNFFSLFNPLGLCKFLFHGQAGPKMISNWVNAICGWKWTMDDFQLTGERLFNLKRIYGNLLGISKKDDIYLSRAVAWPKPDGKAKGVVPNVAKMLAEYYRRRGWSDEGIPRKERLQQLGLEKYYSRIENI